MQKKNKTKKSEGLCGERKGGEVLLRDGVTSAFLNEGTIYYLPFGTFSQQPFRSLISVLAFLALLRSGFAGLGSYTAALF